MRMMKKSSISAASAVVGGACTAVAIYTSKIQFFHQWCALGFRSEKETGMAKFEPRFDGLRFIETLVTAHR